MKIHVCLVSDQTLANFIPALMERPEKVLLVVSETMAKRKLDARLKKLLEHKDITVDICLGAPDTGLAAIQEFALELAGKLEVEHPNAEITLNATGGTKLMALGFVEFFRGIARSIIYTDTAHLRIETLPDTSGVIPPAQAMADVIDVPLYLAAQGIRFRKAASDNLALRESIQSRKAVAKYLARHAAELDKLIGALNRLADKAFANTDELREPCQQLEFTPYPNSPLGKALKELDTARVLDWKGGSEIIFINIEKTQFLRGGWLEEYAFHIFNDEHPFDVRLGVEVTGEASALTRNEFDVLAAHRNRLLFIECKTLRFNPNENDNELAYKLDSLGTTARGLFGETWLLSARAPTDQLVARLKDTRIRLIDPTELGKLREHVQSWMQAV